jgi:hypothetical protein
VSVRRKNRKHRCLDTKYNFILYLITLYAPTYSFNVHGSAQSKNIPIYIQQDATLHSFIISGNCSTCFEWYFHPSSNNCIYSIWYMSHRYCYLPLQRQIEITLLLPAAIAADSSNGVTNTRCCRYSCLRS